MKFVKATAFAAHAASSGAVGTSSVTTMTKEDKDLSKTIGYQYAAVATITTPHEAVIPTIATAGVRSTTEGFTVVVKTSASTEAGASTLTPIMGSAASSKSMTPAEEADTCDGEPNHGASDDGHVAESDLGHLMNVEKDDPGLPGIWGLLGVLGPYGAVIAIVLLIAVFYKHGLNGILALFGLGGVEANNNEPNVLNQALFNGHHNGGQHQYNGGVFIFGSESARDWINANRMPTAPVPGSQTGPKIPELA